ncbi:protein of unknown function [Cupriavidus taiwanensis]|nr:protein of unknown function [Cupriavidus taiwanensis]
MPVRGGSGHGGRHAESGTLAPATRYRSPAETGTRPSAGERDAGRQGTKKSGPWAALLSGAATIRARQCPGR